MISFERISSAIDLTLMKHSSILIVGTGGSFSLAEALVRCGAQDIVAVDPDNVDCTNLSRQGYYPGNVGSSKVEALHSHLLSLNPDISFTGFKEKIQDLPESKLTSIFRNADLALILTDSFDAQAFCNKYVTKYRVPAVFAGYYEKSRACEIFFFIPGITPACFRCAVSPRYSAQQNAGNEILVSSNENTMFHSLFLDSVIGMLSLAILHNHTRGFTFSNWFGNYYEYNFIQIQVHPDLIVPELKSFFDRKLGLSNILHIPFIHSVHQRIEAEIPPKYDLCPDCKGLGAGII